MEIRATAKSPAPVCRKRPVHASRKRSVPRPVAGLVLCLSLAVASAGPAHAQSARPAPARGIGPVPEARIDSVFRDLNRTDGPGCTVGIFERGEIAFAKGYGMANLEYAIALEPRSVFHVASISKQFTAFAVELLVSDGLVSWDDPIQEYVPEIPRYERPVTLRHLAHHKSGIRDQWNLLSMAGWRWEADLVTQENALELMSRQTALNFPPGDAYLYSNSGFTLLAAVVERVTGKTLRAFAEERIFGPLGMASTHFHDDHQTVVRDRAYGYRHSEDEGWKISIPDFAIVGASSLFTTVEDMARWDRNLRDRVLGDDALHDRFLEPGVLTNGEALDYAHGIAVGSYRGQATIGHGGADAGYRTSYLRFPELDVGIASFCNFARANPGAYVRQVADVVLEDRLEDPAASEPEPERPEIDADQWAEAFDAMAGFYRDPRQDRPLHIWTHDGLARVQAGIGRDSAGVLLVPEGDGVFAVWPVEGRLTVVSEEGRPMGIEFDGRRFDYMGPPVTEVDPAPYVGRYWSDELGAEYRIEPGEGEAALGLVHRVKGVEELRPTFEDGFWSGGDWFTFQRDAAGRVTGFTWSNGRVWKVSFVRSP